jgi:hypothetical protein
MTSRGDEVQQSVNSVIPETRVTLDARLLSKDVVILAFEVTNNFLEAATRMRKEPGVWVKSMYANSLSMLSPKPGVSTIVRAIRTPSSSSSGSSQQTRKTERMKKIRTNIDGLDSDTFLDMSGLRRVRNLMGQNLRFAEGVNECGSSGTRGT